MNLFFALATEKPDDPQVWLQGGQLALSQPGFTEVALDWTAQAQLRIPGNPAIAQQRAEALTLSGQCAQALPLWRESQPAADPAHLAARILCETVMGENPHSVPADLEQPVSRELLKWYPRLLRSNARSTIETLNARVDSLQSVLPSAARVMSASLEEAGKASSA
jgi:hypothetical protein